MGLKYISTQIQIYLTHHLNLNFLQEDHLEKYVNDKFISKERADRRAAVQYALTEQECKLLANARLPVERPVPQDVYVDEFDFSKNSNNFYGFFVKDTRVVAEGDFWSSVLQSQSVFRRFCLIRPDLANDLIGTNMTKGDRPISKYYEAYQIMAGLVDATDVGVLRQTKFGSEYDNWFLCR